MDEDEYLKKFLPERWKKLRFSERFELLQKAVVELSEESGWQTYPMELSNESDVTLFDDNENVIKVNPEELLERREGPFQVMFQLFKAVRHGYQQEALRNPELHDNKDQLTVWEMNLVAYIEYDPANPVPHIYQPVEEDRTNFADSLVNSIFRNLELKLGTRIEPYQEHVGFRQTLREMQNKRALNEYGQDFRTRIFDEILLPYYSERFLKESEGDSLQQVKVQRGDNGGGSVSTDGEESLNEAVSMESVPPYFSSVEVSNQRAFRISINDNSNEKLLGETIIHVDEKSSQEEIKSVLQQESSPFVQSVVFKHPGIPFENIQVMVREERGAA